MWDMKHLLAPAGSTSNNTHAGYRTNAAYYAVAFKFVVEATGATPTVTWKVQGTVDPEGIDANGPNSGVSDANAAWFDIGYITDATDTIATAARTTTSIGSQIQWLSNPVARKFNRFRLVTSANTNVTYRCEMYLY